MWIHRFSPRSEFLRFRGGKSVSIQKKFQWKYTLVLMGAVFFALLVCLVPLTYFFNQNYAIFSELAYTHSPALLDHLERERTWLNVFLLLVSVFTMAFCWVFGMKSTARIIGPVLVLQNHINSLSKGQWSIEELTVRNSDEFRDLISSYNYLYHCIRQLTQEDLRRLEALVIDSGHRNAQKIWEEMIQEKSEQLGLKPSDPASTPGPFRDSRHAS
jgi:hypothetical protein